MKRPPEDGWKIPEWVALVCIFALLFVMARKAINNIVQNKQRLENGTYVSP